MPPQAPTKLLQGQNNGVIADIRLTDYRAGGETAIVYKALNPSGNWLNFKPTDEWQRRYFPPSTLGYDTNSCQDFSCMNTIEAQIQRMLAAGEIPQQTIDKMQSLGYFDVNGYVNFSDWFNAVTAGTTWEHGNTSYAPWDAVRSFGVLPQSKGFAPNDFLDYPGWFGTKPTPEQYAVAKQFLTMFDVKYEWITAGQLGAWDAFEYHIKQAPLHILVPTNNTWDDAVAKNVGPYSGVNHAISMFAQEKNKSHTIVDHYNRFVKKLEWNYYIPFAIKGVVTVKVPEAPVPAPVFTYVFNVNLRYGDPANAEVHKLQEALQYLGYMAKGVFGPFGPLTKGALAAFQTVSGIPDPDGQGTNFGKKTRAAMNNILN